MSETAIEDVVVRTLRRVGSPPPSLGNTLQYRAKVRAPAASVGSPAEVLPAAAKVLQALALPTMPIPPPAVVQAIVHAPAAPPPPPPLVHEVKVVAPRILRNQRAQLSVPPQSGFLSELNNRLRSRREAMNPPSLIDVIPFIDSVPGSRHSSVGQDWDGED